MNLLQRENFKLRDRIVELKGVIQGLEAHLKMEKATLANWDKMTDIRIDRIKELEGMLAGQSIQDFVRWTCCFWILGESMDRMIVHMRDLE